MNSPEGSNGNVNACAAMQAGLLLQPHPYVPKDLEPMEVEIKISHCGMHEVKRALERLRKNQMRYRAVLTNAK